MTHLVGLLYWCSLRVLSEPHPTDTKYNKTFLMTYKSFSSTNELFDLLVARFWIQPPDGITPAELEEWKRLKQHVVRARLVISKRTSGTSSALAPGS